MGLRGPKRTPTKILERRGSTTTYERGAEPEVAAEYPDPPEWLQAKPREYWAKLAPMLVGMGVLGKPYTVAYALLVDAIADYVDMTEQAAKVPAVAVSSAGARYQEPLVGMRNKAWQRVLVALREFGATPSAISSVTSSQSQTPKAKGLDKYRPGPRLAV
jgi:P27 family predicted phage terminase small subunit